MKRLEVLISVKKLDGDADAIALNRKKLVRVSQITERNRQRINTVDYCGKKAHRKLMLPRL